MPDYSKSIIYTIRSRDNVYVGSTIDFRSRKNQHKKCIYNENGKLYNLKLYKTIRENNYEWVMRPYSKYPCKDKLELTIEEEKVRQLLKADLNMCACSSGLTKKEYLKQYREEHKNELKKKGKQYREEHKDEAKQYREEHKDEAKQYYEEHKVKLNELSKQYNEINKDKISEQKKEYYKKNKSIINEQTKQWYEKNKDECNKKALQKVTCECGCVVAKAALSKHRKTKKHINFMEKLNQ
jgi:hypothetical protein